MYIPGTNVGLIAAFKGDNQGPPFADEAMQWVTVLGQTFPAAQIVVSTFDDFVSDILPYRNKLPLIAEEIGDTWIHGVSTDPRKSQDFRETLRVRAAYCAQQNSGCPDATKLLSSGERSPAAVDPAIVAFDRLLMKLGEHTWGLDIKSYLNDTVNWTNQQFQAHLNDDNFQLVVKSWHEQRAYLTSAIAALGPQHTLAKQINAALAPLHVKFSPPTNMVPVSNWQSSKFMVGKYVIGFGDEGGINFMFDIFKHLSIVSAAESAVGQFVYTTLSAKTYSKFLSEYAYCNYTGGACDWFGEDFGKPNVSTAGPEHKVWKNRVVSFSQGKSNSQGASFNTFYLKLEVSNPVAVSYYGAPSSVSIVYNITSSGIINMDVVFEKKTPTRLPEASFISFLPDAVSGSSWIVQKLDERVDSSKVVVNGSKHLHVQNGAVTYSVGSGAVFSVDGPDAPLVSIGSAFAMPIPLNQDANQNGGAHFCLHNNIWGTKYVCQHLRFVHFAKAKLGFAATQCGIRFRRRTSSSNAGDSLSLFNKS